MEEQVVQALAQCMDPTPEIRQSAESFIASLQSHPGFPVLLIRQSHNESLKFEIRQLAAILLKNQLSKWKGSQLSVEDKELIKANLLNCLKLSVPEKIRLQYEEIALVISKYDYPWDGINEQIHWTKLAEVAGWDACFTL